MADYIKIPTDFFDSEPISVFEQMPERDSLILLYLELLCIAYRENKKGIFKIARLPLTDAVLEVCFKCDNIGEKLATLEKYELIKREETSIQVFKFWNDRHDRSSARYIEWRKSVLSRDNYTCRSCGTKNNLQAHHIIHWVDSRNNKNIRYDVDNGITLCKECHLKAHGGRWRK